MRVFAYLMLIACLSAEAAPNFSATTISPVGDVQVLLPLPTGFVETSASSPDLWRTAQMFGTETTRTLSHYVLAIEFDTYKKGHSVVFSEYSFVKTPRQAEKLIATQSQFDKLRVDSIRSLTELIKSVEPSVASQIEKLSKDKDLSQRLETPLRLRIGDVVPVSINANRNNFVSYTVLSRLEATLPEGKSSNTWVQTVSACLIKGKVILMYTYRLFRGPQDIAASREYGELWAKHLFLSN